MDVNCVPNSMTKGHIIVNCAINREYFASSEGGKTFWHSGKLYKCDFLWNFCSCNKIEDNNKD